MADFDTFKTEWLGQRIGDPLLVGRGESEETKYQCVSFIKQYWREQYDLVVDWPGNAIDLWYNTNTLILAKFAQVPGTDTQKGDIVILETNVTPIQPGRQPGHVVLDTGNADGSVFEALEQNGATGNGTGLGNDAIRTRRIPKSRIAGILRPRVAIAQAPAPTAASYEVVETYPEGKLIRLNNKQASQTMLWGMNYHFDYMKDHPVEVHDNGEIWTVTNKVHHEDGYDYYRREGQVDGFNVLDCDDYTPPAPAPYVPPAAPVPVKLADVINLVTFVPTYSNELDAANRSNTKATGSFPPGKYYQFATSDTGMLNIGLTNQAITTVWINPKDNKAPEIVPVETTPVSVKESAPTAIKPSEVPIGKANDTAWKLTYRSYHADRSPDTYEILDDYTMQDYGGTRLPIKLTERRHINIAGEFTKNGVKFYRARDYHTDVTFQWWYGIPLFDDLGNPMMRKVVDTKPSTITDLWHLWRDDIKNYLGNKPIWDVVFRKSKRSK
jgi:hypothetical protein